MFTKLTIPQKIFFTSSLIFVLFFIIVIFSIYATRALSTGGTDLSKHASDLYIENEVKSEVFQMKLLAYRIMDNKNKSPNEDEISELKYYKDNLSIQAKALDDLADNEKEKNLAAEYRKEATTLLNLIEQDFINKAGQNYHNWNESEEKLISQCNKVIIIINSLLNSSYDGKTLALRKVQANSKLQYLIVVIGVFAITAFILLNILTIKSIKLKMNNVIDILKESSDNIRERTSELVIDSEHVIELSSTQAQSITETTASVEEITGMVNNNLENSKIASNVMSKTSGNVKTANQRMAELQKSMNDILIGNDKITELVKVINNIGEKTEIMNEIVFQTKLLSFNASVEAERAGEHGRGFAVVAQEVGNLAQMSGKASSEIASIVKDSIKQAEAVVKENQEKVKNGNASVIAVSKELAEINTDALESEKIINQILGASREQASGIKQINLAMNQLDKATIGNTEAAKKSTSLASNLATQSAILTEVVEQVKALIIENKELT